MTGKKRSRKASAKSKATVDNASKDASLEKSKRNNSNNNNEDTQLLRYSPLFHCLAELHKLALDAPLCHDIMQSLADGTAPVLELTDASAASAKALEKVLLAQEAEASADTTLDTATTAATTTTSSKKKKKKRARFSEDTAAAHNPNQASGRFSDSNKKEVTKGGFWIMLGAHMINQLLSSLQTAESNVDSDSEDVVVKQISQVLALVSYYLARILLPVQLPVQSSVSSNNSKFNHNERAAHKVLERACSSRARSLLGRAILSISVGALAALEFLTTAAPSDDEQSLLCFVCWTPATLALDIAVRLTRACPKPFTTPFGGTVVTKATNKSNDAATSTPAPPVFSSDSRSAAEPLSLSSPASASSSVNSVTSGTCGPASTLAVAFWNQSQRQLDATAMAILSAKDNDDDDDDDKKVATTNDYKSQLESICENLWNGPLMNMPKVEASCVADLVLEPALTAATAEKEAQKSSPTKKRVAGACRKSTRGASEGLASQKTSASQSVQEAISTHPLARTFRTLLSGDKNKDNDIYTVNTLKMDGRVAAKRWSSMTLVWLIQGQKRMLEAMKNMLSNRTSYQVSGAATMRGTDVEVGIDVALSDNMVLMALLTRLAGIVTEAHAHSGSRAPSGGLDSYVRSIFPLNSAAAGSASRRASSSKKLAKKSHKRALVPDLRDIGTVVLYQLLQAHEDCLEQKNSENRYKQKSVLVNFEDVCHDVELEGGFTFNPVMTPIIEGLCRAVSATACSGNTVSTNFAELAVGQERLLKIASIFVMQNIRQDAKTAISNFSEQRQARPLDVHLVRFALTQFISCLKKADTNHHVLSGVAGATSGLIEYDTSKIASLYNLLAPIPVPTSALGHLGGQASLASSTVSPRTSLSSFCSYAGILASGNEDQEDELLALFVRSVAGEGDTKSISKLKSRRKVTKRAKDTTDDAQLLSSTSQLYSLLLFVAKRAYDEPFDEALAAVSEEETMKRPAPAAKEQVRKRRKSNEGLALTSQQGLRKAERQRSLNVYRASLAAEVNSLLTKLLSTANLADSRKSAYGMLRQFIKLGFREEHLLKTIELTKSLDDLVIAPRTANYLNCAQQSQTGMYDELRKELPDAPDLTVFEKSLWLSHMSLCIVIATGGNEESTADDSPSRILRTSEMRLTFFRAISNFADAKHWPLWLPPALRTLISTDIVNRPVRPASYSHKSSEPENFIANAYVRGICEALESWTFFPKMKIRHSGKALDYGPLLSLKDARLFMLAVGRLCTADRKKILGQLLAEVRIRLTSIAGDESAMEVVKYCGEYSSFVARVVTVCSNLAIFTVYPALQEKLNRQVKKESHLFELPVFVTECDWYRMERCFMGVYDEWESPKIPLASSGDVITHSTSVVNDLSEILETSLSFGFDSARNDHGHLLFAAWNALGNKILWGTGSKRGELDVSPWKRLLLGLTEENKQEDTSCSQALLQIREDVCRSYIEMQVHSGKVESLPLAAKLMVSKEGIASNSGSQIKKGLRLLVENGEKVISNLVDCNKASPIFFSTLEAAAIYIAFGVASYSKPSNEDAFSVSHLGSLRGRRPRGYSSDSEMGHSDLDSIASDSDDDLASRVKERLSTACNQFGAAPTHPDWLDENCRLQFGVEPSEALDVAQIALRALKNLLSTSHERHDQCLQNALNILRKEAQTRKETPRNDVLARKLIVLTSRWSLEPRQPATSSKAEKDNEDDRSSDFLASLFDLDADLLGLFLSGRDSENLDEVKASWCLNSSLKILGRSHEASKFESSWHSGPFELACSQPELRFDSQWEVLLGMSVGTACRDVLQDCEIPENGAYSKELHQAFLETEFWYGVCETAVSCMMPAAALLRYGLARGGRKTHPLALDDIEDAVDDDSIFRHCRVVDTLAISVSPSRELKELLCSTLSVLAQYTAKCSGDMPSSLSCHSVASNLLMTGRSFEILRGFEASRFALTSLVELNEESDTPRPANATAALQFFNRQLASVLEDWGCDSDEVHNDDDFDGESLGSARLLDLLCNSNFITVSTVAESGVKLSALFANLDQEKKNRGVADLLSKREANWRWDIVQEQYIIDIVALLLVKTSDLDLRTRTSLARTLNQLIFVAEEVKRPVEKDLITSTFVKAFKTIPLAHHGNISSSPLNELLRDLSVLSYSANFCVETCSLLVLLATDCSQAPSASMIGLVVDSLVSFAPKWLTREAQSRNAILHLLALFGCCTDRLSEVGSVFLTDGSESGDNLEASERFYSFIEGLCSVLNHGPGGTKVRGNRSANDALVSSQQPEDQSTSTSQEALPRACSYTMKRGFHGQHWYNCYTCGLTWDKGCCTLCAIICHKGHDVSYSRYSSFFCDCGAEDGGEDDATRVACKCLSPVPKKKMNDLFRAEGWSVEKDAARKIDKGGPGNSRNLEDKMHPTEIIYSEMAKQYFPKIAEAALDKLFEEATRRGWIERLFEAMRQKFKVWNSTNNNDASLELSLDNCNNYRYDFMRYSLKNRIAVHLKCELSNDTSFVALRNAKANSFQCKFSGSSIERLRISKNEIRRNAVVADSRGRLVIAEPCSLLFCSAAAATNVAQVHEEVDWTLSRSAMPILGSQAVAFNVVGMKLCHENDRHLVIWGASVASVVILEEQHRGTKRHITLSLDLEPNESVSDYVIKCEWIPGFQTCVAVGCGRFVALFDLSKTDKDNRVAPFVTLGAAFDSNLKDISLVPMQSHSPLQPKRFGSHMVASLFIMLEDGRLYQVNLNDDKDGNLSVPGEHPFDATGPISLPTAGVCIYDTSEVGVPGAHSCSFGDGVGLTYLEQSNLLLYECSSSCVLALTFDPKGTISGSFELLPHTFSSEAKLESSVSNICGPYTQWTELGQSGDVFRVACVGQSPRSNQPKLVLIEFNGAKTTLKDLTQEKARSTSISLYAAIEGLCAFSLPFRFSGASDPDSEDGSRFAERTCLCVATSTGSLLFFGEKTQVSMSAAQATGGGNTIMPFVPDRSFFAKFPVTIFERLKNLSEDCPEEIIFGGEGLSLDTSEIRRKLSREGGVYLLSPRRDGFTLNVSLGPKSDHLAILGVRFQVGCHQLETIPKKIIVQGRPVELSPGMKKWYSISLADDEVALAIRTGVLAIGITSAFDPTCSPILDSLEIYALEKNELESWLPRVLCTDLLTSPIIVTETSRNETAKASRELVTACRALGSLCSLVGPPTKILPTESELLKQMVQDTAQNHDSRVSQAVNHLLVCIFPRPQARNSVKDEGALQGCSLLLNRCQLLLEQSRNQNVSSTFDVVWFTVREILRKVLRTASSIARLRPISYLRAADVIAEHKISSGSIAVDSSKLIGEGLKRFLPVEDICELFVELALAESAIVKNIEDDQGETLASFYSVQRLLECHDSQIVERSCQAVKTWCQRAVEGRSNELFQALDQARILVYQCDGCASVPINSVRYTLDQEDKDIDLCSECYNLGKVEAERNNFSEGIPVVVNGKTLDLSCALYKELQPVPIVKAQEVMGIEAGSEGAEDEDDLQKALRLSLAQGPEKPGVDQSLEQFIDGIFSSVLTLLTKYLEGQCEESRLSLLLSLLTALCVQSNQQHRQLARARKLGKLIADGISRFVNLENCSNDFQNSGYMPSLIMCLRSLAYLLAPDESRLQNGGMGNSHSLVRNSAPAHVVCEVHGVPAVKRKAARGEHKDKRFYVCGLERSQRCKFFKWSDEIGRKTAPPPKPRRIRSPHEKEMAALIWQIFNSSSGSGAPCALHLKICKMLEKIVGGWQSTIDSKGPLEATKESQSEQEHIFKLYDNQRALQDFCDGVFCSLEKLHNFVPSKILEFAKDEQYSSIAAVATSLYADGEAKLLEAALELIALIATEESSGMSRWFSLLCEIIGSPIKTSSFSNVKSCAKRVLKACCGQKSVYHAVRDHYCFGFQCRRLLKDSQSILRLSLLLQEKARRGGPRFKHGSPVGWADLKAGGLIGSELLLSEDFLPVQKEKEIGKTLDELWNVAKNRTHNWRRFSGAVAPPKEGAEDNTDALLGEFEPPAPIVTLFWLACSLPNKDQVKALKLLDLALTESKRDLEDPKAAMMLSSEWNRKGAKSPEEVLLHGSRQLGAGDVHAWLLHFAFMGKTADIRHVACSIASKLFRNMSTCDVGALMVQLPFQNAGCIGKNCLELLGLLISEEAKAAMLPAHVKNTAEAVLHYFMQQFQAVKNNVCFEIVTGSTKNKFDLSRCVHCMNKFSTESLTCSSSSRSFATATTTVASASSSSTMTTASTPASSRTNHSSAKREWLETQISPYTRGRLDNGKETTTNDAFCSYRRLKCRVALSEIHVQINDPRGRFIKTIRIYFTSRPVNDVQVLKSDSYLGKWQHCASINLTRGASRASCTLSTPVTAANLKIEYSDFFDRAGTSSSKAADGSLIVHCPRCTRQVSNAHGVCGACGEVAFQCRKCRHINYDQLQSFLCVECGYCSSAGSISFDLVAGVASNAIAVTSDADFKRLEQCRNRAKRLNSDLREALKEKLLSFVQLQKNAKNSKGNQRSENVIPQSFSTLPELRRAFLDGPGTSLGAISLLLDKAGKKGWAVQQIASPSSTSSMSTGILPTPGSTASERTRSLLNLARTLRSEAGTDSDSINQRRVHMGADPDLLTLLENAGGNAVGLSGVSAASGTIANPNGLVVDPTDPLSRLLSSFQTSRTEALRVGTRVTGTATTSGRARRSGVQGATSPSGRPGTTVTASTNGGKKQCSSATKEALEECEKLYSLMRECEREAFELDLRLDAWQRLERDELADRGFFPEPGVSSSLETIGENAVANASGSEKEINATDHYPAANFSVSHCSVCSVSVCSQLLLVWIRFFEMNPAGVAATVAQDTIELLLEEKCLANSGDSGDLSDLMEWKRFAVREIATKSPVPVSRLVLNELAKRLRASRDVACADILGSIIRGADNGGGDGNSNNFELMSDYVALGVEVLDHEAVF